jgi:hypothetical protein
LYLLLDGAVRRGDDVGDAAGEDGGLARFGDEVDWVCGSNGWKKLYFGSVYWRLMVL